MAAQKIYKPTIYVSGMSYLVFIVFLIGLLMSIYGLIISIINEVQWAMLLSLPLQDAIISMIILVSIGSVVIGAFIGGLCLMLTMNVSIHVREHDFRVTTFMYKSNWIPWNKIVKIRSFSLYEGHSIVQIGIDGLGWIFKLSGLLFWMYPYGAINIGENNMNNGRELLKVFKQKRPDLF